MRLDNRLPNLLKQFVVSMLAWQSIAYVHLIAGFLDTLKYRPDHQLTVDEYLYYFLAYTCWALFSVGLLNVLSSMPKNRRKIAFVALFLTGLIVWLPTYFLLDFSINAWIQGSPMQGAIDKVLNTPNGLIFLYAMLYTMTFGVCNAVILYRDAKTSQLHALQLAADKSEAQLMLTQQHLQLLQSQLSPHFLFNCLGAISALARTASKNELLSAVSKVGNLLRFTVESAKFDKILLREELEFVDDYISLQALRFGDRFNFQCELKNTSTEILIPPFLIQPLIENCFSHEVAHNETCTDICLSLCIEQAFLVIRVTNTTEAETPLSVGLKSSLSNLRDRLSAAYSGQFVCQHGFENGLFVNVLQIPLQEPVRDY
ncbi:sensor histidine kinase [Aliiglaciecola sp. M165]|uniref:sensor histidine kinase n=1 Tax=Aliiglaciecola sp. M165 TaxID=2593649 RepID=UPI00117CD20F|nr:histidine kinase [Aliiglaciecola sp. M165]TRY33243.1 hypothetical protein FM019_04470 [Aliiglaciecola sp. M165]